MSHGSPQGGTPAAAEDETAGCTIIWQHPVTRASPGYCGREPAPHQVTATCRRCGITAAQRVCGPCWKHYRAGGLCGACMAPLEITEEKP